MNERVLIVDDEKNIAKTLELIWRSSGYEAKSASSAELALEVIADWAPDLAIVDVILPGLDGIQFAKILDARYPQCRLLFFSGQSTSGDLLEQARREGYRFEVVAKPVHPKVLLEKTAELLSRPGKQLTEQRPDQVAKSTRDVA